MSTVGPLANQARSVYRLLLRASSSTFAGDVASQAQFRSVIRSTFLSPTLTSPIKPSNTAPPPTSCSPPSTSPSPTGATSIPTPAAAPTSLTASEYEEKLEHWREVAKILRENIVQGEAIKRERAERQEQAQAESAAREKAGFLETDAETAEEDALVYRLRLTPHTELGDNETIRLKTPPKLETVPFPNRNDAARERRRAERERRIREREEQK